jgi:hypothetical protein
LNFLPEPHQHGSLRPIFSVSSRRRVSTFTGDSVTSAAIWPASAMSAGTAAPAAAAIASRPVSPRPPEVLRLRVLVVFAPEPQRGAPCAACSGCSTCTSTLNT